MTMTVNQSATLVLGIESKLLRRFSQLFGMGVRLNVRTGQSIKALLCNQLGVSEGVLQDRIQTIFHNGKIVDDVDRAVVGNGSTLALSAAMPGVLGATLRKGGYYAPMRRQISHVEERTDARETDGTVTLKLFNLLVVELGPGILHYGILMKGRDVSDFMNQQAPDFLSGIRTAELNGIAYDPKNLTIKELGDGDVCLRVIFEP